MKLAPLLPLLAFALLTSCATSPPSPTAAPAATSPQQLAAESATALNAKDYAKAQTAAAEATRLDPQFEEAWVGYGMASARLGQADRARDAYEHALALHQARMLLASPDAGQVFQQIFLLSLLGRAGEAETLLSRARLVFPADPQISMLASNFSQFQKLWAGWAVKPK